MKDVVDESSATNTPSLASQIVVDLVHRAEESDHARMGALAFLLATHGALSRPEWASALGLGWVARLVRFTVGVQPTAPLPFPVGLMVWMMLRLLLYVYPLAVGIGGAPGDQDDADLATTTTTLPRVIQIVGRALDTVRILTAPLPVSKMAVRPTWTGGGGGGGGGGVGYVTTLQIDDIEGDLVMDDDDEDDEDDDDNEVVPVVRASPPPRRSRPSPSSPLMWRRGTQLDTDVDVDAEDHEYDYPHRAYVTPTTTSTATLGARGSDEGEDRSEAEVDDAEVEAARDVLMGLAARLGSGSAASSPVEDRWRYDRAEAHYRDAQVVEGYGLGKGRAQWPATRR